MILRVVRLLRKVVRSPVEACKAKQNGPLRDVTVGEFSRVHPSVAFDVCQGGRIEIGRNVEICQGVILATYGGEIRVADNVFVGPYSIIYGHGDVFIGKDTMIAAHSVIIPANHRFDVTDRPMKCQGLTTEGIIIEADCWLGARVTVLDGVTIGTGSVVGAGAVVSRSIPEYSVAMGSPARVVRSRMKDGERNVCGANDGHAIE